jgi:hypothetical protein
MRWVGNIARMVEIRKSYQKISTCYQLQMEDNIEVDLKERYINDGMD